MTDIVWCQEEPKNQGAWYCSHHHFVENLGKHQIVRYVGREATASTAVGYASVHARQQQELIAGALTD